MKKSVQKGLGVILVITILVGWAIGASYKKYKTIEDLYKSHVDDILFTNAVILDDNTLDISDTMMYINTSVNELYAMHIDLVDYYNIVDMYIDNNNALHITIGYVDTNFPRLLQDTIDVVSKDYTVEELQGIQSRIFQ